MKKKLQIFISSTYVDLQEERQAAVEAVLGCNNIPAGMELFKAGNNSQWETIKKWINESNIYMLILGGRYGSIETTSQKSYTQLEYEYAISQGIPVFATVLSDNFLAEKAKINDNIYETQNKYMYDQFKILVMSKMVKIVDDCKDIKLAIHESVSELKEENDFEGWTRGISDSAYAKVSEQNAMLLKENNDLKEQIKKTSVTPFNFENREGFWIKDYTLAVHGMREFMGNQYQSQIQISMQDIYISIAPLMMVPIKIDKLKSDFEGVLLEKYFPKYHSLYLQDNQFQDIKVQIYSANLIKLDTNKTGDEIISLNDKGISMLCSLKQ